MSYKYCPDCRKRCKCALFQLLVVILVLCIVAALASGCSARTPIDSYIYEPTSIQSFWEEEQQSWISNALSNKAHRRMD